MTTHNNDKWPEKMFQLAPLDATHIYADEYRKQDGDDWYALYNGSWLKTEPLCKPDYTEIPERERVLNRLADSGRVADVVCFTVGEHVYNGKSINERRRIRIEAGLIEVDNPVTSSLTNSQAKEMEMDMLKIEPTKDTLPVLRDCNTAQTGVYVADTETANLPEGAVREFLESPIKIVNDEFKHIQNCSNTKGQAWSRTVSLNEFGDWVPLHKETAPAEPEQWKDGWPPVGEHCEKLWDVETGVYYEVKVFAIDGNSVIYRWLDGPAKGGLSESWCGIKSNGLTVYRPILTEAQKAERERNELKRDLASLIESHGNLSSGVLAESVIDYLERSYRLTKEQNND